MVNVTQHRRCRFILMGLIAILSLNYFTKNVTTTPPVQDGSHHKISEPAQEGLTEKEIQEPSQEGLLQKETTEPVQEELSRNEISDPVQEGLPQNKIPEINVEKPHIVEKPLSDNVDQDWIIRRKDLQANSTVPKKVILYTYFRGGSTFLGSLFEANPEVMYWYESLGAFYKQYYGTRYRATNQVWFDEQQDHALRILPAEEIKAISTYMDTIFKCDLQQMYPMSFANTFLKKSKTTRPLKFCAPKEDDCVTNTKTCSPQYLNDRLRTECPSDLSRIRQCWLRNEYSNPSCKDTYQVAQCYGKKRLDALSCISKFEENCRSYRLTATKVHRLSMQAVEEIILKIPDVYIIFYIRDPRGMWMSREDRDHGVPMKALCQQMLNDYNLFVQLDNKFPGVFIKVKYEEYAERPIEVAKSIYEHIQEPFTQKLFAYIEKITSTGKVKREDPTSVKRSDSNKTASAWRNTMSYKVLKNANKVCNDFLIRANYSI